MWKLTPRETRIFRRSVFDKISIKELEDRAINLLGAERSPVYDNLLGKGAFAVVLGLSCASDTDPTQRVDYAVKVNLSCGWFETEIAYQRVFASVGLGPDVIACDARVCIMRKFKYILSKCLINNMNLPLAPILDSVISRLRRHNLFHGDVRDCNIASDDLVHWVLIDFGFSGLSTHCSWLEWTLAIWHLRDTHRHGMRKVYRMYRELFGSSFSIDVDWLDVPGITELGGARWHFHEMHESVVSRVQEQLGDSTDAAPAPTELSNTIDAAPEPRVSTV
jgi:hypothetical protein